MLFCQELFSIVGSVISSIVFKISLDSENFTIIENAITKHTHNFIYCFKNFNRAFMHLCSYCGTLSGLNS